ncbi:MAG: DUF3784 domain-containing protein [Bacteroidales bacterium]|nr:DUF3784 domain-containing protein [Porphyromonas sp.]MDD6934362.1 DUF3784 domain-containing protein [Bacteroidales bacterium]MDY3101945.1 DUF3784 domain-containing protein [Porphyromonas sp.]
MNIGYFLCGGVCLILAPLVYRYPMLIAGYNTMPKKEQEKIDVKHLKKSLAGALMIFGFVSVLFGFLPEKPWVNYTYLGFILVFTIVTLFLVSNKRMRKK